MKRKTFSEFLSFIQEELSIEILFDQDLTQMVVNYKNNQINNVNLIVKNIVDLMYKEIIIKEPEQYKKKNKNNVFENGIKEFILQKKENNVVEKQTMEDNTIDKVNTIIHNKLEEQEFMYDYSIVLELSQKFGIEELEKQLHLREFKNVDILLDQNEKFIFKDYYLDIIEYNLITLKKRKSLLLEYITMIGFLSPLIKRNNQLELVNQILQFENKRVIGNLVVDISIFNEQHLQDIINKMNDINYSMKYDINVSCFFDGSQFHNGTFNLEKIIEHNVNTNNIVFISQESIYPLSLMSYRGRMMSNFIMSKEDQNKYELFLTYISDKKFVFPQLFEEILFDAIPGSGKTTELIKQVESVEGKTLILVPTKMQEQELKEYFKQDVVKVQTIDSFFYYVNSYNYFKNQEKYVNVFIDEIFMVHSGQVRFIINTLASMGTLKMVHYFGDSQQIPYYPRVDMEMTQARMYYNEIKNVRQMNITYRCVKVLKPMLETMYCRRVEMYNSAKTHLDSIITSPLQIIPLLKMNRYENYKIITFTQAEKQELLLKGIECNTVAEVQGQTFCNVVLVRMNKYERMIYKSKHHILVALSRHTRDFKYVTVSQDAICKMLDNLMNGKFIDITPELAIGDYVYDISKPVNNNQLEENQVIVNKSKFYEYKSKPFKVEIIKVLIEEQHLQEYLDSKNQELLEFDDKANELMNELLTKGVYVNNKKYYEMLEKEKMHLEETIKYNCKIGQFIAPCLPKGRGNYVSVVGYMKSLLKRNADVSKLRDPFANKSCYEIIQKFKNTYFENTELDELSLRLQQYSVDWRKQWIETRTTKQLTKLLHEEGELLEMDLTTYNAFLKSLFKNKFEEDKYSDTQVSQIVAGANTVLNEYFTVMVKQFTSVLIKFVKPNVVIYDGISPQQFELLLNEQFMNDKNSYSPIEMDYSKYDKNQDFLDLYYQVIIMHSLGIDLSLLTEWTAVHMITKIKNHNLGITLPVYTQRKSGDVFTFMGNTLFTMLIYSTFYSDLPVKLMVFGGDDSLIYIPSKNKQQFIDYSQEISNTFNMDIKYMNTTKSVCFASRYIVQYLGRIYCIPDLMKQLLRHNRIMKTKDHIIAELITLTSLNECYLDNFGLVDSYLDCIIDRGEIPLEERENYFILFVSYLESIKTKSFVDLYHDWKSLPEADTNTLEQLRKRFEKKVGLSFPLKTDDMSQMERQLLEKWNINTKIKVRYCGKLLSAFNVYGDNIINKVADNIVNIVMKQKKTLMDKIFSKEVLTLKIDLPSKLSVEQMKAILLRIYKNSLIKENDIFKFIYIDLC